MAENPDQERQGRILGEASVRILPSKDDEEREAQRAADKAYKDRQLEIDDSQLKIAKSNRNLTVSLAIFTLLGVVAGGIQACFANRSVDIANRSAKAAESAAYAACVGAQISRNLLIETEKTEEDTHEAARAAIAQSSVAVQTSIPVINPEIGTVAIAANIRIMHDIAFKNTGNTPALNVHAATRTILVNRDETPPFIYPEKMTGTLRGARIPANSQFPLNKISSYVENPDGTVYVPSQTDYLDFIAGKKDVLIFGYVNYSDVFGGHHSMKFCQAARHTETGEKLKYGYSECFKYNKTDTAHEKPLEQRRPSANEIEPIPCEKPKY